MRILRPVLQWLAGLVLAAGGLWIFFRNIDTRKLADILVHSNPLLIAACAGLAVLSIWFRSVRSAILLPSCTPAQKKNLFPILMISFMINNILPARMGEVARAMLLWKRNGYSGAVSVGSIVLERILDTIVYMSTFFLPIFLVPALAGANVPGTHAGLNTRAFTLQSIALLFCAGYSFFVLLLIAYSRFPHAVIKLGRRIIAMKFVSSRLRSRLNRIGRELISNLDWTFSGRRVVGIIVLSYAIVSCYAAMTYLLIHDKAFGFLHGLFAQSFAAMGAAVPLAPGYVGTLHAVFLQGLVLCGVEREKAVAATIFFHAVAFIAVTLLGLYYYFSFGVTFKDISESKKAMETKEGI
jgi:glycosyltransferase 2 family protein